MQRASVRFSVTVRHSDYPPSLLSCGVVAAGRRRWRGVAEEVGIAQSE